MARTRKNEEDTTTQQNGYTSMTNFDLSGIEEDTLAPVTRARDTGENPMTEHLQNSYNASKAMGLTVQDGTTARYIVSKLNQAGKTLEIGVSIQTVNPETGDKIATKDLAEYPHPVRVKWLGKKRKQRSVTASA